MELKDCIENTPKEYQFVEDEIYEVSQFVEDMEQLKDLLDKGDALTAKLSDLFGSSAASEEGALNLLCDGLTDFAVKQIAARVGDDEGWISWFLYDTAYGGGPSGGGIVVNVDGTKQTVTTYAQLWGAIQKNCNGKGLQGKDPEPAGVSDTECTLLNLLADIRIACGDDGIRRQDELVEYIKGLYDIVFDMQALSTDVLKAP